MSADTKLEEIARFIRAREDPDFAKVRVHHTFFPLSLPF